jgi:ribonuclease HII
MSSIADVQPSAARTDPYVDLSNETALLCSGHDLVGGVDEVGRGAWAGPLLVGVVVVDASTESPPAGTRDSKALTPKRRRELRPELESWCVAWALGEASAREIDHRGLTKALALATARAVAALPMPPTALIVDGPVDFISRGRRGGVTSERMAVRPIIGADDLCASVAAASVLAKVARDAKMSAMAGRFPRYGFDQHKGYGTREHARAIATHGLTAQHRRTWSFAMHEAHAIGDSHDRQD